MSEHPAPPGVEPALAESPITPGRHHVHISYIALRTLRKLKELSFALFAFGIATLPRIGELPAAAALAGVAAVSAAVVLGLVGFAYISYKHFAWELTDAEVHVYEGFFFKKETHIPLQRIHSIDYSAKIADRILGVVTLRIETAGGGQKAEAEIASLRLAEAEALRYEVFARKRRLEPATATGTTAPLGESQQDIAAEIARLSESARGAFAGEYVDASPLEYEHRLTLGELALAGISNSNVLLLALAGIGGLSQILSMISGSDSAILDYAQGAAKYLLSFGIAVAAVVAVLSLLLAWTISILTTVISYGGFTVRRRGGRVELEMGLLEHRFTGVAIDRIQSVRIKQGVLRRMIGFAELSLETVSSPNAEGAKNGQTGLVIHPLIRRRKIGAFIADLLPEFSHAPVELSRLPMRALGRAIFRTTAVPGLAVTAAAVSAYVFARPLVPAASWLVPLVAVALLLPCPWLGYMSWRTRGHAVDDTMLVIRNGVLDTDTRIVPRRKIQWAKSTDGPFQRRLGLAGISVWTAGGTAGSAIALHDIDAGGAAAILGWVEPRPPAAARRAEPSPADERTAEERAASTGEPLT